MNNKHVDKGYSLLHWATSVEVVCPKCAGVGVVEGNPYWRHWHGTFYCSACSHVMKTGKDGWQGPLLGLGRRPCRSCGHKWVCLEIEYQDRTQVKAKTGFAQCPQCNSENEIELEFIRKEPSDHAIDPYFGLNLALIEPVRHGSVWVYNSEHLKELKDYISAKHRESSGTKWSYFTRLPKWLKSAKNREEILKAISRLEKRAVAIKD